MKKNNNVPIVIIVVGVLVTVGLLFSDFGSSTQQNLDSEQVVSKDLRKVDLEIGNMFCIGCRSSVVSGISGLPGVVQADADPRTDSGWVLYDPLLTNKEEIVASTIFQAYPATILDDQPYSQPVAKGKAIEIPAEIEDKLNLLAKRLSERGVTLESFFQEELDEALSQGYFDKANNLLDNYLKAYE